MALPTLDATFASAADLPRRQMLAKWLVGELGSGSIADYWTLPERYLWAKIAVAAGAPRPEADYISLPTRYVWSDIYNAVAGTTGIHNDWSEKEALGHIAAAYRGDTGDAGVLATYINWPWRYQVASIITAIPEPELSDPYFSNVELLMHFDGENESQVFTDSSVNNFEVVAYGDSKIDTTIKKFGSGSGYFDGSEDHLGIASGSEFEFPSDFTIELWVYLIQCDNEAILFSLADPSDFFGPAIGCLPSYYGPTEDPIVEWLMGNDIAWDFQLYGSQINETLPLNTWNHLAMARSSGVIKCFVNGVLTRSIENTTSSINFNNLAVIGGRPSFGQYLYGHIDELRVTNGIARYTANFAPPTNPFPNQ